MDIAKNTLLNIKLTRNLSFCENKKKINNKSVKYSNDTIFDKTNRKSTTSIDMFGNIIRPIIINNKYYIRHDQLYDKTVTHGIF
jgi:hypothetical protein